MILKRLRPWENNRQRDLLRGVFHIDDAQAKRRLLRWFEKYDIVETKYPEHRMLVRMLIRFPDLMAKTTLLPRLNGLKRQMWARAQMNLKASEAVLAKLTEFDIPWVLIGSAVWFLRPDFRFREELDVVEICVPDAARSTASHLLQQIGWRLDWSAPENAVVNNHFALSKGNGARIRLSKPSTLFLRTATPTAEVNQLFDRAGGPAPDAVIQSIMIGRSAPIFSPSDQWVFDYFNLLEAGSLDIDNPKLPQHTQQFLKKNFVV
ncbi:MAG: hypothetical protein JKY31_07265 [Rhodobacteraceae bacterium]|nr:hypothetical protein [Paracoccaceae bacterium]